MASTERSRTVKTLLALMATMFVGACVLYMVETPPACLPLRADSTGEKVGKSDPGRSGQVAAIRQTDVPIQYIKWCNIILHDFAGSVRSGRVGLDRDDSVGGCHFLIGTSGMFGDEVIRPTRLWRRQLDGKHIVVPGFSYNENSIGIRLLCDTDRQSPTSKQMAALTDLVRALQVTCQIPSDRVYLHSELGAPGRPGRFFPVELFRSRLITATR